MHGPGGSGVALARKRPTVEEAPASPVSGGGSYPALPAPALSAAPNGFLLSPRASTSLSAEWGAAGSGRTQFRLAAAPPRISVVTERDQVAVDRSPSVRPGLASWYFSSQSFFLLLLLLIENEGLGCSESLECPVRRVKGTSVATFRREVTHGRSRRRCFSYRPLPLPCIQARTKSLASLGKPVFEPMESPTTRLYHWEVPWPGSGQGRC